MKTDTNYIMLFLVEPFLAGSNSRPGTDSYERMLYDAIKRLEGAKQESSRNCETVMQVTKKAKIIIYSFCCKLYTFSN